VSVRAVSIGEVVENVSTWSPAKLAVGDFDYIDLSAVDQDHKRITMPKRISTSDAPSRARQIVRNGDVLVSTVRPNLNGVAKVMEEHDGMTASTGFCVLRPNGTVLNTNYLFQWVKSPGFIHDMVRKATGASYPAVSDRIIKESEIPLPPLDEQKRIAAILDKADQLRQKRRQAIALLDSLTQSIFLEMFGDPVSNPMGWTTHPIDNVCRLVRGSSPRPQGDPKYFGGPVPRLMIADITRDGSSVTPRIDSLTVEGAKKSRFAPTGTVVMAVSGDVGLVAQLAVDACVHDGFVAFLDLDLSVFDPLFFMNCLQLMKREHAKATAGAVFQNTTTSDIKKIRLPAPRLELQGMYIKHLRQIRGTANNTAKSRISLERSFNSLQNRAFSGQL